MANQQENMVIGNDFRRDQIHEGQESTRDQDVIQGVIDDEKEAMRRAKLPKPGDDAPEAENPKIAEIESVLAATRH